MKLVDSKAAHNTNRLAAKTCQGAPAVLPTSDPLPLRPFTHRVYNARTGELEALAAGHTGEVSKVAFSPGSAALLTASADTTCRLWDTNSGRCLQVGALDGCQGGRGSGDQGAGGVECRRLGEKRA